ncbi:TolC family protein [Oceanobacter antarcticus]|uniref:TolC family protein n=1 Tax=Oceanobacter antarcticus TaxID=3133425 RepID=A0ABW8NN58_9GAMM
MKLVNHNIFSHKKPIIHRFFVCLTILTSWHATTSAESRIGLTDAIDRALQGHPEIVIWSYRQQDNQARTEAAGSRQPPQLELSVEDAFGTEQYKGTSAMQTTLSARWLLEGDQINARTGHTAAQQRLLTIQQRVQLTDIQAETSVLFVSLLADQERLQLALEALVDEKEILKIIQRRVDAGQAPNTDLILAHTRLTEQELALEEFGHRLQAASLRLSAQWGTADTQLHADGNIQQFPPLPKAEAAISNLLTTPSLAQAEAESALFSAEGKLASEEAATPWSVGAGVRHFESTGDYALIAQLSMPLGSNQRQTALKRSSHIRDQQQVVSAQARLQQLTLQIRTLLMELEHSQHVINTLTETILPTLNNGRQQALKAYEQGQLDYVQWDNIRQQWLNTRTRLLDESETLHRQWIELQRLTGQAIYF